LNPEDDILVAKARRGEPLTDVEIIDAHGHLGPYGGFYVAGADAKGMVEVMDEVGIDAVCISSHTAISSDWQLGNDLTAAAAREFPGRFLPYATINPTFPEDVVKELERCFNELGMRMIKLHPGTHDYPLDGKNYQPVYEFAREHNALILTHTWEGSKTCNVAVAIKAADKFPGVNFLMGHSGGPSGYEKMMEAAKVRENVYLDLACSRARLGQVEMFVEEVGAEKVLYGSDISFLAAPPQLGKVVFARISFEDKKKILAENFKRITKTSEKRGNH